MLIYTSCEKHATLSISFPIDTGDMILSNLINYYLPVILELPQVFWSSFIVLRPRTLLEEKKYRICILNLSFIYPLSKIYSININLKAVKEFFSSFSISS